MNPVEIFPKKDKKYVNEIAKKMPVTVGEISDYIFVTYMGVNPEKAKATFALLKGSVGKWGDKEYVPSGGGRVTVRDTKTREVIEVIEITDKEILKLVQKRKMGAL